MSTTYDPFHPKYFDEADLREEMTRVYDLCHGCRLCFKFCSAFPTLFEFVDSHDDQDAARSVPPSRTRSSTSASSASSATSTVPTPRANMNGSWTFPA